MNRLNLRTPSLYKKKTPTGKLKYMKIMTSIILSLCLILLFSNQVLCQNSIENIKPFNVIIEYDKGGNQGVKQQQKILYEGESVDIQEFN